MIWSVATEEKGKAPHNCSPESLARPPRSGRFGSVLSTRRPLLQFFNSSDAHCAPISIYDTAFATSPSLKHLSKIPFKMPPPRAKPQPEDSRSEASSTKEKVATSTASALNGKGRRPAGIIAAASSLRDVITAGPSGTAVAVLGTANPDSSAGVCRN